jgi:predicted mannosyl-3-phosphoglycerate phosphatase (HAD superfamily)
MRIAEALVERKALKTKMEEIKKRIYQNAQVQDGEKPTESPLTLIEDLSEEVKKFEVLVNRINKTNVQIMLESNLSMAEALIKRDMLKYRHLIMANLADKATPTADRYSQREIKFVASIDITDIRKKADEIAKECRQLDMKIQQANWLNDLLN